MDATELGLRVEDVSKRFGETRALDGVSIDIPPGSVHALVGENGAGKSTLGRIISGVVRPDSGTVAVGGRAVEFRSPRDALEHGIATIAQEIALVPGLTAAENVWLGAEPRRFGIIRRSALRSSYARLAEAVGFDVDADADIGSLPIVHQQQVEILRAMSRDAWLVVMDEPSARLSADDAERLHAAIRDLVARDKSVLLISHALNEVMRVADTVTVLRDGAVVARMPTARTTESSLIEAMLGRTLSAQFPRIAAPGADAPTVLEARQLSGHGFTDVSLRVRAGEIVGLAGLVGAGRSELARAILGAAPIRSGDLRLNGVPRRFATPRGAHRAGIRMIPESRHDDGLFAMRPIRENVTVGSLERLSRLGLVRRRLERGVATAALAQVGVRASAESPAATLSGGNQQKLLFARALQGRPTLLVADEPTRGVDVGAKRAIYDLLATFAADGLAILLISSEMEEILGLAHRVVVMRGGRVAAQLGPDEISEPAILAAAFDTPGTGEVA